MHPGYVSAAGLRIFQPAATVEIRQTQEGPRESSRAPRSSAQEPALWVHPSSAAMTTPSERPSVGLAFSGGGFRATAFGLGALRALHDRGILPNVRVVSGVSGGSLLAAMWAYGPENFDEFYQSVTELLRGGLQMELARRALAPRRLSANLLSATWAALPGGRNRPRMSTRTEGLVDALMSRDLARKRLKM